MGRGCLRLRAASLRCMASPMGCRRLGHFECRIAVGREICGGREFLKLGCRRRKKAEAGNAKKAEAAKRRKTPQNE